MTECTVETTRKPTATAADKRTSERTPVTLAARLTWKDQRGATRFASVVTRDVSECGVYVEALSVVPLPMYRLVQFQLEREARDCDGLPASLRNGGRLLSAVYRVTPPNSSGRKQGFALRLMIDPKRRVVQQPERQRATA